MWREENRQLFAQCLQGLAQDETVQRMRAIPQHVKGVSCYDHCVFVAYLSFTLCRALGLDYRAAARAGLLHDLYLQHWEHTDIGPFRRLVVHPRMALENARRFGLNRAERDAIAAHMWPLTLRPPRHAVGWAVCLADKAATGVEMLHLYRRLGVEQNVRSLADLRAASCAGRCKR